MRSGAKLKWPLGERHSVLKDAALIVQFEAERLDLTEIPSSSAAVGHAHIVTQAWEELEDVFVGMSFRIAEGPEVENRLAQLRCPQYPAQPPGPRWIRHALCGPW